MIQEKIPATQGKENKNEERRKRRHRALLKLLPALCLLFFTVCAAFLPKTETPRDGTTVKAISAEGFPVTLMLEQNDGMIQSAWLRTPAGTREIDSMNGLSFVSEWTYTTTRGEYDKDNLLWRTSYTNFNGDGVHLWIGISATASKAYIATTPYSFTKWDNIPAKLIVPRGTAIYISPALPFYDGKEPQNNRESYSFVYTIRMTPQGPAFVPVPSVYRQLSELLQAGIRGEYSPENRLAYARTLDEFNKLAEGNPPSPETLLGFPISRITTLSWK